MSDRYDKMTRRVISAKLSRFDGILTIKGTSRIDMAVKAGEQALP
jgi:hypothetical protein